MLTFKKALKKYLGYRSCRLIIIDNVYEIGLTVSVINGKIPDFIFNEYKYRHVDTVGECGDFVVSFS